MSARSVAATWGGALVAGALLVGLVAARDDETPPAAAPTTSPTPSVVVSDDFETGEARGWTAGTGIPVQVLRRGEGRYAAHLDATDGPAWAAIPLGEPDDHVVATARVRVASAPRVGRERATVLALRTAGGAPIASLTVGEGLTLGMTNGFTGVPVGVPITLRPRTWHDVGLDVDVAGAASTLSVVVDGATVESWTTDLGDTPVGQALIGEELLAHGADVTYDSVAVGPAEAMPTAEPVEDGATESPVLYAAGDIACDPKSDSFGGGEGTESSCQMKAVADLVIGDSAATAVAALGDVQYYCGGADAFDLSYDPTWGRFLDITYPAVGNHEYIDEAEDENDTECDPTGTATPYFDYFGDRAGKQGEGYYSYDLGSWHVVVLNTTCSQAGGCHLGSPQEQWLRRDLAENPARCTLAYWHIPLWSSGGRANENSRHLTRALHEAGADVVLTGHDHLYERFEPQDADGNPDADGLRAWVVGTGGANHTGVHSSADNSAVIDPFTFGVLRMVLRDGSYDWTFVPANGAPFTDTGSARCH